MRISTIESLRIANTPLIVNYRRYDIRLITVVEVVSSRIDICNCLSSLKSRESSRARSFSYSGGDDVYRHDSYVGKGVYGGGTAKWRRYIAFCIASKSAS